MDLDWKKGKNQWGIIDLCGTVLQNDWADI